MPTPEEIAQKNGLIRLPASDDYLRLFEPRGLHWGEPGTIEAIMAIARWAQEQDPPYRVEIGNITGPDRKNRYSVSHHGKNFDMAYPYADGASGALDMDGKTSSPYRVEPAAVDYDKLQGLLAFITSLPSCSHVLVGPQVYARLNAHLRAGGQPPLAHVEPYAGHEDHLHVTMKDA